MAIDAVTLALVQNKLDHIAKQTGQVMTRTARSPIFIYTHDFSCYITDAVGRLISQADGIPVHTGGGGFVVNAVLKAFDDEIREGDVFLSSDPYVAGGNHLPDWVITRPVFSNGRRIAFVCNRAHQSDIGGGAAGTYNPSATEIFHEGIRLPPLRLVEQGSTRKDLWELLLLNSRCPDFLDGDLRAMLGSTQTGAQRVAQMAQEIEGGECQPYFEGILDYADRCMRDTLRSFPDGVFEGADKMDSDCFADRDIWIRVKLTKRADKLVVDFSGTDPQIRGFKNSPLANTFSSVYVAVTAFLAPKIPRNEGTYRSIEIIAPEGSLVNPLPPAPQTMSTVHPNHEIVHACWQALGQARPDLGCAGWGKLCQPNMSADRPGGGKYVMYHWGAYPGAGAVNGRDGFHQMGSVNNLGALSVPNCEDYEQVYPVRFLRHELREDAGGPGQFRGGTGVIYEVQVEADAEFAFRSEGVGAPTGYGVAGGGPGAGGEIELTLVDGRQITPPRFSLVGFGPLTMRILSAAGGGWGDPKLRDPASVLRDVRDGIVSDRAAREIYGVALKSGNREIDERATRSLRANSRC